MIPILNIYKYSTIGLAVALAGALTLYGFQHSATQKAELKLSKAQTDWQAERTKLAEAHAGKLKELKGSYETLVQDQATLYDTAASKAAKLEQIVASSDVVANRLRNALKAAVAPTYIATTNTPVASISPATIKAGDMCANMFRRIDEAATGIGTFAERSYGAAETCVGSYETAERSLKAVSKP